jgi:hypothetical protein
MKTIFKENAAQQKFEKDGYIVFDVLEKSLVEQLRKYYYEKLNFSNDGLFKVGLYHESKQQVLEMKEFIKDVCIPSISKYLGDTRFVTASYVVKFPSPNGIVPVHQDWSFVDDEKNYYSATCWIPLVDVKMNNGAIGIIQESNNYFDNIRPSPSRYLKNVLTEHGNDIFPYLKLIEMTAGQALFFNNSTFHGSPPNNSEDVRLAVGLSFTHRDAKIVHYYLNPLKEGKTALKYDVDEDFFIKYSDPVLNTMYTNKELISDYKIIEEVSYNPPFLEKDPLVELVLKSGNEWSEELSDKLNGARNSYDNSMSSNEIEKNNSVENIPSKDERTFFQKYTPKNILLEINYRLKKIFGTLE